jgi:hypothetical protein
MRWRWPLWVVLTVLIYYPLLQARPIFDDIAHMEFAAAHGWDLLRMGPIFFRPFERVLIGVNWMWSGNNFWLVHGVALAALVIKTSLVYSIVRRLTERASAWLALLAALIFLTHPMNVSAVGKIDTLSEDLAALFALLGARLALASVRNSDDTVPAGAMKNAVLAAGAVFMGMMSKEAFAGFAAALPFMFAVAVGTRQRAARQVLGVLVLSEALAAGAYFTIRLASGFPLTGALIHTARYQLRFGANVAMNIAAQLGAIAFPGNTVAVFVNLNILHIAVSAGLLLLAAVIAVRRLPAVIDACKREPRQRRMMVVVLIAIVAGLFPSCLIPELISENQTAQALPFVIIAFISLFGFSADPTARQSPLAMAFGSVAVVWLAAACTDKVLAAREASFRAERIGAQIEAAYRAGPVSALTVCFARNMRTEPKKYSVFSMPDDAAAFFQLYRLRMMQPSPTLSVVDLRNTPVPAGGHCDITVSAFDVVRAPIRGAALP